MAQQLLPRDYPRFLDALKERIREVRFRAALSANRELIRLYWHVGGAILDRQRRQGWGQAIVKRLALDLTAAFPEARGFSAKNIWRMRALRLSWTSKKKVAQAARLLEPPEEVLSIPWFHNVVLFERIKDQEQRLWYARETIRNGWSRNVLLHQIATRLHRRQGLAITNFSRTLKVHRADLAQQTIKDEYVLDFLNLGADIRERELEKSLLDHVQRLLMELGKGFAFVGRQYRLNLGGEEFYLDLLFFHLTLRCYVVVELKAGPFKPEYAGKMNFYLTAVDERLRRADDAPSIGLILCRSHNRVVAEYALRELRTPIGVASYRLTRSLPRRLAKALPATGELEKSLTD